LVDVGVDQQMMFCDEMRRASVARFGRIDRSQLGSIGSGVVGPTRGSVGSKPGCQVTVVRVIGTTTSVV
jgi:hypothetical protein